MARTGATNIADLRHRALIERPTVTMTDTGGQTRTWASVATVWCKITPVNGGEAEIADGLRATQSWILRIRYRTDVDATCRVTWNGRVLNVRTVIDIEGQHEWIDLHVREGE